MGSLRHLDAGKKNGRQSLPCQFLLDGLPYCPCAPLSVGEDKHRQPSPAWHAGFKTSSHPPQPGCPSRTCSLYQLCIVPRPNATHTLADSHTGQIKIVYSHIESHFPYTCHKRRGILNVVSLVLCCREEFRFSHLWAFIIFFQTLIIRFLFFCTSWWRHCTWSDLLCKYWPT